MNQHKTNQQPCLAELTLSGFTSVTIPCDMQTRHRLPHRADVKDEATGKWVTLTWRNKREGQKDV